MEPCRIKRNFTGFGFPAGGSFKTAKTTPCTVAEVSKINGLAERLIYCGFCESSFDLSGKTLA